MKDLCSTLFYKIKFNIAISGDAEESDLLWIIVKHIKDWMTHKHNKPKEKEALSSDSHDWTLLKNGGIMMTNEIRYLLDLPETIGGGVLSGNLGDVTINPTTGEAIVFNTGAKFNLETFEVVAPPSSEGGNNE